jgi:spoIIIJ-associated protein
VEWVEASGKSLTEAKEIVLDLLGVAEDDAEFVVLSEPKAGLFGRLRGEARVQARVRPVAPPPKRGRRPRSDRRRDGSSNGAPNRSRSGGSSKGQRSGDSARSAKSKAGRGRSEDQQVRASSDENEGDSADQPANRNNRNGTGDSSGRSTRRRSRGSGGSKESQRSNRNTEESEVSMEESLSLEQQGEAAQEFVAGLVREFGLDADVSFSTIDEETVQVAATGSDLGLLVGQRGATLAAVQDLTRTFVQRQSETRTDRILVDVAGYREKRIAALKRFTEGIAEEVKSSGEERALEPMSPADRKVVHDAVNEIDGVETRSDGSEPARYVVIQPAG